jgi:hypothetical protein
MLAGVGTPHEGVGYCRFHKGNRREGARMGAWLMAHAFAQAMRVSPWDALLGQLYLLQGQVAWLTAKVSQCGSDEDLAVPRALGGYAEWVEMLEQRGDRLTKVAKMAIDAGIAERMVAQVESQANMLYEAARRTSEELGYDEDQEYSLVSTLARNFRALEAEHEGRSAAGNVVAGQLVGEAAPED